MIEIVPAYDRFDDIRILLSEYTEMLLSINYEFRLYLELQKYDDEALNPSEKYAMPYGRLYLALYDGRPAGCIALHRLEGTACEMKRLYVRPEYRGHHIATMLIDRILEDASVIGYDEMYLDTLPELADAVALLCQNADCQTAQSKLILPIDGNIIAQFLVISIAVFHAACLGRQLV